MMCDERLWKYQREALSDIADIEVGDLAGAESIAAIAERILQQAPPSFALAGLSMGGIVAFEIWRQAPQRVERMALLDTNFRADAVDRQQLRNEQIERVSGGDLQKVLRDELKPNYLATCHRGNTDLLDRVLAMGMELGVDTFIGQSTALRDRDDSTATLATIDCPVLVLCGEEDDLCPVSLHREMATLIGDATLEIVPQCGHLSTMEQPATVARAMQTWLQAA